MQHSVPCKGKNCTALIYWGHIFGKKHPFNPDGSSHFDTCPDAHNFRGGYRARGDRDTYIRNEWRKRQIYGADWEHKNISLSATRFSSDVPLNWDALHLQPVADSVRLEILDEFDRGGAPFILYYPDSNLPYSAHKGTSLVAVFMKSCLYDEASKYIQQANFKVPRTGLVIAGKYRIEPTRYIPQERL